MRGVPMCCRYALDAPVDQLSERFRLVRAPDTVSTGEIRPTSRAIVVDRERKPRTLNWGLRVEWDKKALINARCETLDQKPTFRPLLGDRCLVPATVYFEWRREGRRRIKNHIGLEGGEPFAIAGLVDGDRFTLVTCEAAPAIRHIHDRMPAILKPEAEEAWLDPGLPFAEVRSVLRPFTDPALVAVEEGEPPKSGLFGFRRVEG